MIRSHWFRSLLNVSRSRKDRRRTVAQSRKPVRLVLESLEDRITPNSTVTDMAGDYTELVNRVAAATTPDTNYIIQISNNFTFDAGGQVTISKLPDSSTLTIEGAGDNVYTLTGNGNRLFDIEGDPNSFGDVDVDFKNLVLTGGGGDGVSQGGAIKIVDGDVTLSGVTVKNNSVTGTLAEGGGVFVSGGSELTVLNSLIANNTASGTGSFAPGFGGSGNGGGIYAEGKNFLTITDSTVSGNKATGAAESAGSIPGSGLGGGVAIGGSGWRATLIGDLISDNSAIGGAAATVNGGNATGGGLFVSGSGSLTILNDLAAPMDHPSIFFGNTARGGAGSADKTGGAGEGGAIALSNFTGDNTTASIGNTTFFDNAAISGAGIAGIARGGGLRLGLFGSGGVTMFNCTVAKNTAVGVANGGGIFTHDQTTDIFANNSITQNTVIAPDGGAGGGMDTGIFNATASQPTLINNLIQGNKATTGPDLHVSQPLVNATNNFINTVNPANAVNTTTNIVGNAAPQLGAVVGVDGNGNRTGGPIYYPLASGVVSIGAGSTSVLGTISSIEGITPPQDEIGDLRTSNGTITGSMSLGAVQPLVPGAPLATTVVPGNATINFIDYDIRDFTITVAVNAATGGTASGGTVSIFLNVDNNDPPIRLGTAAVGENGIATVSVPSLPQNMLGKYQLIENYSGNADFAASNGAGTLNITSAPISIVPGNATVNTGSNSPFTFVVGVNSPESTVDSGSIIIELVSGNTITPLGLESVTLGTATVSVSGAPLATIAALAPGSYQLVESYFPLLPGGGVGPYSMSKANGTLTVIAAPTSIVAGNAALNYYDGSPSPAFSLTVGVNSSIGTVNTGSVSVQLVSGGTTTSLGTAALTANGTATLNVAPGTLPALSTGNYQLIETYKPLAGGQFAGSTANGALAITTVATSVTPGNAIITVGSTGSIAVPVGVNSSAGAVSGNVTLALVRGDTSILLTPAGGVPLSGGSASVNVTVPAELPIGTYHLVETYLGNGHFVSSSAIGTLTVNPVPVPVASLQVAIDAAALILLTDPNFAALMGLQTFAGVFLHLPVQTSIQALLQEIQFLYPQTDGQGYSAIIAGMLFAEALRGQYPQS